MSCSVADTGLPSPSRCVLTVNLLHCKYSVLRKISKELGLLEDSTDDWDVMWVDAGLGVEGVVRRLQPYQRINHFPGMVNIYRKDKLSKTMTQMAGVHSGLFDFTPKTWSLPEDRQEICRYLSSGHRAVIMKPALGAQGRGIVLATLASRVQQFSPLEKYVVQPYLSRPLLVDGYKFDLRIYVLVTSCNPLRVLLYREGLCRFCTSPYAPPTAENAGDTYMHLTNYSINKHNSHFVPNDGETDESNPTHSSKRSLSWLRTYLRAQGRDDVAVWKAIADVVVKTLISVQTLLTKAMQSHKLHGQNKNPFSCFELLGFDIILDEHCTPTLLEVNHMPSFSTDSVLDLEIKTALLRDTLRIVLPHSREREDAHAHSAKAAQQRLYGALYDKEPTSDESVEQRYWKKYLARERIHRGDFELVYPTDVYDDQPTAGKQAIYDHLLHLAAQSYGASDTVSSRSRSATPQPALSRQSSRSSNITPHRDAVSMNNQTQSRTSTPVRQRPTPPATLESKSSKTPTPSSVLDSARKHAKKPKTQKKTQTSVVSQARTSATKKPQQQQQQQQKQRRQLSKHLPSPKHRVDLPKTPVVTPSTNISPPTTNSVQKKSNQDVTSEVSTFAEDTASVSSYASYNANGDSSRSRYIAQNTHVDTDTDNDNDVDVNNVYNPAYYDQHKEAKSLAQQWELMQALSALESEHEQNMLRLRCFSMSTACADTSQSESTSEVDPLVNPDVDADADDMPAASEGVVDKGRGEVSPCTTSATPLSPYSVMTPLQELQHLTRQRILSSSSPQHQVSSSFDSQYTMYRQHYLADYRQHAPDSRKSTTRSRR